MMTIGIDPGLGGSIAVLNESATVIFLEDMPTLKTTKSRRILDEARILMLLRAAWRPEACRAVIERAMVMPKQGSASGFKIGVGYGQLLGILAALQIPRISVIPQTWQKAIIGKCEPGTSKDRARAFAQGFWPGADLGTRKSQDRADALCLALYGIRHWTSAPQAHEEDAA